MISQWHKGVYLRFNGYTTLTHLQLSELLQVREDALSRFIDKLTQRKEIAAVHCEASFTLDNGGCVKRKIWLLNAKDSEYVYKTYNKHDKSNKL